MKKLLNGDPQTRSADTIAENLDRLKALFPEAFAEGKIDFDVLRQLLGGAVGKDGEEKYGLNWHGKRRARQLALTPSTGTLRPCPEDSVDWDATQNLMIEGDNLEVLKLLQKSYAGKVKLIYIDPPYNTGNNLIYPNDYRDGIRTYLEVTGQARDKEKQTSNPASSGRFHTNWLSMIYPRLKLARSFLAKDGMLICTIDDNELAQLGTILREIFEEGTYKHVCVPIIHNPRGVQGKNFSYVHEYGYFVYPSGIKAIGDRAIEEAEISWSQFRNWGGESLRSDAKNCFYPVLVKKGAIVGFGEVCGDEFHPDQTEHHDDLTYVYPIDNAGIERKWRYARQSVDAIRHLLRARPAKQGIQIEIGKNFGLHKTVWADSRYDANEYGTRVVAELTPQAPFTFPKSLWAVYDSVLAATGNDQDAVVMDFFAGSGTTGHAVMQLNKETLGCRRFVLVQLPEQIAGDAEFPTIADITKERLRRAGAKIKEENPDYEGDLGFRVFKLDKSNIRAWDPASDDLESALRDAIDHIRPGRTEQDILYELLLKLGLDLCAPIETRQVAGKAVHSAGGGMLIACLAESITSEDAEALASGIADWHAEAKHEGDASVIFRDSAFADDIAKTNTAAILNQRGLKNVRSL